MTNAFRLLVALIGSAVLLTTSNAQYARPKFEIAPAADRGSGIDLGVNADLKGRRLLPDDSPWHRDISREPVDPNSSRILARIGWDKPLHPDFGTEYEGAPIGIPYVVVPGHQPRVPVAFTEAPQESDPGPYPIPADAPNRRRPRTARAIAMCWCSIAMRGFCTNSSTHFRMARAAGMRAAARSGT
jgi:hypothetical protein